MPKARCTIVGIAGGSGSGKTSLATSIASAVGGQNVLSLSMDAYYKDLSGLAEAEKRNYNFDRSEAFDIQSLLDHLQKLKSGVPIPEFQFDYLNKKRVIGKSFLNPKPIIVLEGILSLAIPALREFVDYKLFVDTPADLRLIRRCRRDINTYQRTFADIADQYEATIREMHDLFVAPSKDFAHIIIPFTDTNEPAVDLLVRSVQSHVSMQPARSITWTTDESEMLLVPGGEFLMGSTEAQITRMVRDDDAELRWFNDERPARTVNVSSFYIDKFPVTNEKYDYFLEETERKAPDTWTNPKLRRSKLPVTGVSSEDALAYCKWSGKRLPTEAEWEKAARGINGRLYPWGDSSPTGKANFGNYFKGPTEVGRFPEGASPYGIMDMAGNVWEWTNDQYDSNYYVRAEKNDPKGPKSGEGNVVRGGSWINVPLMLRCAERDKRREPLRDLQFFGFRCVASLEQV